MKQSKFIGVLILTLFMYSSCNVIFDVANDNKFVECKSNCYNIDINGSVINMVTNDGVKNMPVTLNWVNPTCTYCPDNTIDVQYSNDSSKFSFKNSIDTSYFSNGYLLNISIPKSNDYIIYPAGNNFSVRNYNDSILKNLKYELYPKTQLLIQLVRKKDDIFETFTVSHTFRKEFGTIDKIISRSSSNQYNSPMNDSYIVETAADIKTYITYKKAVNAINTILYETTDSIICKKNTINTYKITY